MSSPATTLFSEKSQLFSHSPSSGSSAIKQMKTITSHLHQSRDLLIKSLTQLSHINEGISNTSANLQRTSYMYDQYDQKTKRSSLYILQLQRRQRNNKRNIQMAFWFLIVVCAFVIIRRVFMPDFYRWGK